jgi:quinol-cytochrome oxidoreductase complex cytochrome b subunit
MVLLAVLRDPARLHRRLLRIPAKLWGVLAMFARSPAVFFPWLDKSPVRSGNYRPLFKKFFWLLVRRPCWSRLPAG